MRIGTLLLLAGFLGLVGACGDGETFLGQETHASSQLRLGQAKTFFIEHPRELSALDMLTATSNELRINDRVIMQPALGAYGSVANHGTGITNIGASTRVGDVRGLGDVFLRSNASVNGVVEVGGNLDMQQGSGITEGVIGNSSGGIARISWSVTFPTGTLQNIDVQPGQTVSRAPGNYGSVFVKQNASLVLNSGDYTFRSLSIEPGGSVILDKQIGPSRLYVRDSFTYRGRFLSIAGDPGNFLVGVASANTVFVEAPWIWGALIAPWAKIELKTVLGAAHYGTFFGRAIEAHQDNRVTHAPSGAIGTIQQPITTPPSCEAEACEAGEYRISVDDCAAPMDSGASCSAGDLCPPGEACIGGTCQDAPTYGEECNTGEMLFDDGEFVGYGYTTPDTPCAYDFANESPLFCANQATPEQHRQAFEDLVNGDVVRSTTIHRYCVRYRGIGETCADSAGGDNLRDLCEPGLVCDNAVCKRPCSTSSQCPCNDGVPAYGCDTAAGFCEYEHTELFTSCTTSVGERCAAPLVCSFYHDIEGEARSWGRCGFDLGESCDTNAECAFSSEPPIGFGPPRECVSGECALAPRTLGESCQDSFGTINPNAYHDDWCAAGTACDRVSGTCLGTLGSPCADNDDCINDLECGASNTCAPACRSGECSVSGLRGDCARGFRDCSVGPECAQVTFPTEEICDGIDNDCNGSTDDDVPEVGMDCMGPEDASTFNCQSGFMVPGKTVCESGEVKCRASLCNPNDVDATGCLCIAAAAASTEDPSKFGLPCGSPTNTPCEPSTRCTPSSACVSDFGAHEICKVQTGVGMCPFGTPKCWTPADVQPGLNCYGAE